MGSEDGRGKRRDEDERKEVGGRRRRRKEVGDQVAEEGGE